MKRSLATVVLLVFLVAFFASSARAQLSAGLGDRVSNWTPAGPLGIRPLGILADVTPPRAFIGTDPCRIVDTRGPAGPYGAPALAAGVSRNFALPGGPCAGIPTGVNAYSLNITVTNTLGPGFILIYPQGGSQPLVSTLNYLAGQTVANAAIVPAGTGGGITVIAGVSGTDLIIDINGYFSATLGNPSNYFSLTTNSGGFTMRLRNLSTTCGGVCGIDQEVNGTGQTTAIQGFSVGTGEGTGVEGQTNGTATKAAGVKGTANGSTGVTYGVYGNNSSTTSDSAGVLGVSSFGTAGGTGWFHTGVRGEGGVDANGVLGQVNQGGLNNGYGTTGVVWNSAGTSVVAQGILGDEAGPLGVRFIGGLGGSGAKAFFEPHPTDPTKMIRYVSLEGPEAGTYFRGTAQIAQGQAIIIVPEDFRTVTDEDGLTVQLTPVGASANMWIASEDLNQIVVRSSRDVTFHYLVQGVRRAYKDLTVITKNFHFVPRGPDDRMSESYSAVERQRLIDNGTYNPDGTVNMATAERAGWASVWRAIAEQGKPTSDNTKANQATYPH